MIVKVKNPKNLQVVSSNQISSECFRVQSYHEKVNYISVYNFAATAGLNDICSLGLHSPSLQTLFLSTLKRSNTSSNKQNTNENKKQKSKENQLGANLSISYDLQYLQNIKILMYKSIKTYFIRC